METFLKKFARDETGAWVCLEAATLDGPNGRIQVTAGARFTRGTSFMGFDMARWLDEQTERVKRSPGIAPPSASLPIAPLGPQADRPDHER